MSIPKEPRQLMITIMYITLTALLALNVSAEIFNAFEVVEKGLKRSNQVLDKNNSHLPPEIEKLSRKKESLRTYAERTKPVRDLSADFSDYVDGIVQQITEETAGHLDDVIPRGYRNEYITTRHLANEGKGEELLERLRALEDDI